MPPVPVGLACHVCGQTSRLSWCSRCHKTAYCSKEHQIQDWKLHKKLCQPLSMNVANNVSNFQLQHTLDTERKISKNSSSSDGGKIPSPSSSSSPTDMQPALLSTSNSVRLEKYFLKDVTNIDTNMAATIWQSLQNHGLVILNNFLPKEQAEEVRKSIVSLYAAPGNFTDGEVINACKLKSEQVRGDQVRWIDEYYSGCKPLQMVMSKLDKLIQLCSDMSNWNIESRTKPMVTCYPGNGTCYKRHVDNPTEDGRLLTCLYYINEEWNTATDGGCLCLYPQGGSRNYMVKCEPVFNRICLFLSNSRVPHEVQPTYRQRFAMTCWYFDRDERQRALMRWAQKSQFFSGGMQ